MGALRTCGTGGRDQRETGGRAAILGEGQEGVCGGGAVKAESSGGLFWGRENDTN